MTAALWILLGLNAVVTAVWLGRHVSIYRAGRILPPLTPEQYSGTVDDLPPLSMLVAAKDEERNIEGCVKSILRQEHPNLQVIAINDRSEDATGAILDRLATSDSRFQAIHIRDLRAGWFGKNNAMREGVEAATADWLCFTDADCVLESPRCLAIAMRHAAEMKVDFLSILPNLDNDSFWERVIQPACGGIMMIWFNPLKVNNPARSNAYANGAFMLMKRSCYDAIGGHESFKSEVNEDMHMARRAKAVGQKLRVVSNENLYTVRMYNSFAQTWNGWSRIFYGCFGSLRRLILSSLVVVIFSLLPWATLITAGIARLIGGDWQVPQPLAWTAAAACAAQLSVMFRFYRLSHSSPVYAVFYPVGAAVGLGALINAMRRLRGRSTTTWRGTVYRGDKVEHTVAQGRTGMAIKLDLHQRRVLGVLIEKSMTTPGSYPLTINSIVTGCNQLSCRDPVMHLTEGQVSTAVHQLQMMQIVAQVAPDRNARSNRFAHRVEERFGWDTKDRAIMAELFLRGPQTLGELKSNASRMSALDDLGYVSELLSGLARREPPCVVELPRQPGKAANKFDHCLYAERGSDTAGGQSEAAGMTDRGASAMAVGLSQAMPSDAGGQSTVRSTLEQRVAALEVELARVKMTMESLQSGPPG